MLAVITRKKGSAPRAPGAVMVVSESGRTAGTIGGGAIEHCATRDALRFLAEEQNAEETYTLTDAAARSIGMVCGGVNTVLFCRLTHRDLEDLTPASEDAFGFFLAKEGSPRAVKRGDALALGLSPDDLNSYCRLEGREGFLLDLRRAPRAVIFGGGHVSRALVPVLHHVGFSVSVLENRREFLRAEDLSAADERILVDYREISRYFRIREDDYVVILTRGHESDTDVLLQTLSAHPRYLGMIGSRRKVALTQDILRERGFSEEDIHFVDSPIGLDIGAETPEEISLSIAAEIVARRRGKC